MMLATQRTLRDVQITESSPGTVLCDFETLLEFVGVEGLRTTGKHHLLPIACLGELNRRMSRPIDARLQRPQQRSFPQIHGLYLLMRAAKFGVATGMGKQSGHLAIDLKVFESWRSLNPTERYFNLLEAWFLHAASETLGQPGRFGERGMLGEVARMMQSVKDKGVKFPDEDYLYLGSSSVGGRNLYKLALLELFGFAEIDVRPPQDGRGWRPAHLRPLPLAEAILGRLQECGRMSYLRSHVLEDAEDSQADDSGGSGFGVLQPLFQEYFLEWKNNLTIAPQEFREGTYFLKVCWGRIWRRLAVPSTCTLDDLANAILNSIDFDEDHLYEFVFRARDGSACSVAHPYIEDAELRTDEFAIGDLPLTEGQAMLFRYDFGDNWEFEVKLERVAPPDRKLKKPKLVDSRGKSPKQYPNWDEDGDDDGDETD